MFKKLLLSFLFLTAMLLAAQPLGEPTKANRVNVAQLYVAYFDRAPDSGGLDYWVFDSGLSLEGISSSFFDQEETQEKYPEGFTNSQFIDEVYRNLFNRDPDKAGKAYWLEELDAERIPRSLFILAIINGAQGTDATILQNKTIVGLAFAEAGLEDAGDARCVMLGVTEDRETLIKALAIVETLKDGGECDWENKAPIADAGPNQIVEVGDEVTLDGNGSSDPDDDNLTYQWSFVKKPADSNATLNKNTTVKPTFKVDKAGEYVVQLIVNDGKVDSAPDEVTVSTDCTPVAVAEIRGTRADNNESDQNLTGSNSTNPCEDTDGSLNYDWEIAKYPDGDSDKNATLKNKDEVNATIEKMDVNGTYTVKLTVYNDVHVSKPDNVDINFTGE